jgi:hypothetical protein
LLFDQIILLSAITFIVSMIISTPTILRLSMLRKEKICISLLAASLFYIFGTAVLLNVDRSRSLYVFTWVDQCNNSVNCIKSYVLKSYGNRGWEEVYSRINEQSARGLMKVTGDQVKLTKSGNVVLKSAEISSFVFNLKGFKIEQNLQN